MLFEQENPPFVRTTVILLHNLAFTRTPAA
jgi:hypothetical protein